MNFETAFEKIISVEGYYSNDSDDLGGKTKYGISQRAYPDIDIEGLTLSDAKEIYRRDYWKASRCQQLPESIILLYFDCVVNCGIRAAGKLLQKAINNIDTTKIDEDGIVGRITLSSALRCPEVLLKKQFIIERVNYYLSIANNDSSQRKFLRGWLNRLFIDI